MTPPSPNQTVINTLLANGWLRRPEEENLLYKVSDGSELSYLHDIAPTLTEPVAGNLLIYDETIGKFHEYSGTPPNPTPAGGEDEQLRQKIIDIAPEYARLLFNPVANGDAVAVIDAIMQLIVDSTHQARRQAARDIFNLAHEYAQEDETMIGSEELRAYHYFNAIHKIGEFDGR